MTALIDRGDPVRGGDPRVATLEGVQSMGRNRWKHETARVDEGAHVGDGTLVWGMAYVMRTAHVGENCMLGQAVHVGAGATVGDRCSIQNGAQIFTGVTLGDDVFIGPHVVFTNVLVPRAFAKAVSFEPTLVGPGASIGANATIICGTKIGEYAMIGAGAVVTKDVLPHTLVVGNPARVVARVCRCGAKLIIQRYAPPSVYPTHFGYTCPDCPLQYRARGVGADKMETPLEPVDAP